MKENIIKAALTVASAGIFVYFQALAVPVIILILVMACDYVTGMIKAWITKQINSKCGIIGIIKKLCYLLVVCCGVGVDWIIKATLAQAGISYSMTFAFGMMACIWLIINELISILENLSVIGVPLPGFLTKTISKLKITVESGAQKAADIAVNNASSKNYTDLSQQ